MVADVIRRISHAVLWVLACALALEVLFRGALYWRQPHLFDSSAGRVVAWDRSMWRYDSRYGYDYIPGQRAHRSVVVDGRVNECVIETPVNDQGNIGPSVPDYPGANLRIALFGDSFSAFSQDGVTWPHLFQAELEGRTGKSTRVLNLGRDGFGVLQMFDFAAVKIAEAKPHLVIFAFNSTALQRDRTWRVSVGVGDDARLLTSIENSEAPSQQNAVDMLLMVPSASAAWCEAMTLRSTQSGDPVLRLILDKSRLLPGRAFADAHDWRTSYVADLLLRGDAFASQRERIPLALVRKVQLQTFAADPQFVKALEAVRTSGVPFLIMHIPLGVSLKNHQEFWLEPGARELLDSLETLTGHQVLGMRPHINVRPEDAMKLCRRADDCHPSEAGMKAYAQAAAKIVAERIKP
jgi:hypothetical protein